MEGRRCTLTLSYDPSLIRADASTLEFTAAGENSPLLLSEYTNRYIDFSLAFRYLSYSVVAIFVLSLCHKMVGAELVTSCQLIYLSNAFYPT